MPATWNGHVYVTGIGGSVQDFTLSAGKLSTAPASQTSVYVGTQTELDVYGLLP